MPSKGVYALVLRLPQLATVEVGRLGKREFDAGLYVYTGSALNSLPGRVARHLRRSKKKHWHIDYLVADPSVEIAGVAWKRTSCRVECRIARRIGREALASEESFGCGDCDCDSHLHYFGALGNVERVLSRTGLHYSSPAGLS